MNGNGLNLKEHNFMTDHFLRAADLIYHYKIRELHIF